MKDRPVLLRVCVGWWWWWGGIKQVIMAPRWAVKDETTSEGEGEMTGSCHYLSRTVEWWGSLHPGNKWSSSGRCWPWRDRQGGGEKKKKKLREEKKKRDRKLDSKRSAKKGTGGIIVSYLFFSSISDPCNPWREREVMGSPRFHSGHRLHIFSPKAVLYFSRPHDTITLLQYEM